MATGASVGLAFARWLVLGVDVAPATTSSLARGSRDTAGCRLRYRRFYTRLDSPGHCVPYLRFLGFSAINPLRTNNRCVCYVSREISPIAVSGSGNLPIPIRLFRCKSSRSYRNSTRNSWTDGFTVRCVDTVNSYRIISQTYHRFLKLSFFPFLIFFLAKHVTDNLRSSNRSISIDWRFFLSTFYPRRPCLLPFS